MLDADRMPTQSVIDAGRASHILRLNECAELSTGMPDGEAPGTVAVVDVRPTISDGAIVLGLGPMLRLGRYDMELWMDGELVEHEEDVFCITDLPDGEASGTVTVTVDSRRVRTGSGGSDEEPEEDGCCCEELTDMDLAEIVNSVKR